MKSGSGDSGHWDSCYDNSTLVEYYCQNNEGSKTEYVCPDACSDGTCSNETGLLSLSGGSSESDSGGFWGWLKGLFGF